MTDWPTRLHPIITPQEAARVIYDNLNASAQTRSDKIDDLENLAAAITVLRDGARAEAWKTPATMMDDGAIRREIERLGPMFDRRGEHSGSPGEWIIERLDELETELSRRPSSHASLIAKLRAMEARSRNETIRTILTDICDLSDYTSPDDQPDLLQMTYDQIAAILENRIADEAQTLREAIVALGGG